MGRFCAQRRKGTVDNNPLSDPISNVTAQWNGETLQCSFDASRLTNVTVYFYVGSVAPENIIYSNNLFNIGPGNTIEDCLEGTLIETDYFVGVVSQGFTENTDGPVSR